MRRRSLPISPYRLYLVLECGMNFLLGISYATITVYWVTSGRLNPLQLLLLGTSLEVSYFVFQLPTGVLADLVSRRLCVLAGLFIVGLAQVMQSLSPSFVNLSILPRLIPGHMVSDVVAILGSFDFVMGECDR